MCIYKFALFSLNAMGLSSCPNKNMLSNCRARIIVVPISPQPKAHFEKYLNQLRLFTLIPISDLNLSESNQTTRTNIDPRGSIHFDFVTTYNKDQVALEEIDLSRQILGVIGLMSCEHVDNLRESQKQFQQIVKRYPTALVSRCFAFNPRDDQTDDTKGIIMIPNVGETSFYLQTMLNDFTSDFIMALGLYAGQLEHKTAIPGPIIISPLFEASSPSGDENGSMMALLVTPEKVKKRTPARIQKLLGDLFLLGGSLEKAMGCYIAAIEGTKLNLDFMWQSAALEAYTTAQILSLIPEYPLVQGGHDEFRKLPNELELLELVEQNSALMVVICELPERYREIVMLHDRSIQYGIFGYYPILQIQASIRISTFLSFAYEVKFRGTFINAAGIAWYNEAKSLTAEIASRTVPAPASSSPTMSHAYNEKPISGVSKLDIMTWITRVSLTGNEYLTTKDYLLTLTSLCTLSSRIKATRKHAFFLRLVAMATRVLDDLVMEEGKKGMRSWSLISMHHVCDLLQGHNDDERIWIEKYCREIGNKEGSSNTKRLVYGWPLLRIGILKEAIAQSDFDHDHVNTILFTVQLLQTLWMHLNRKDQQFYSDLLVKAVLGHKKQLSAEITKSSVIQFKEGVALRLPFLLRMEIVQASARHQVKKHEPAVISVGVVDTFLYSPFSKTKTKEKEMVFAADEIIHVDVTLANPFLFDFDIQRMRLSSLGGLKALNVAAMIPAESKLHTIRLSCVPTSAGSLSLTGLDLKMLGGCIEENIQPLQRYLSNLTYFGVDGKVVQQSEQERFGNASISKEEVQWKLPLIIIPAQPLLELHSTSLGRNQAITLFEGETSAISFTIRNIGQVPINYLFVKIEDNMAPLESDSSAYEQDVFQKGLLAFYPLDAALTGDTHILSDTTRVGELKPIKLDVELQPGDQLTYHIGLFGKRDCIGASIEISYGHVEPLQQVFYTRDLVVPFLLTVVNALSYRNEDVLYNQVNTKAFLLTFDLRNEWDDLFDIQFDIFDGIE